MIFQWSKESLFQVFAHFDIVDYTGKRVAEGHKASFCLEDRECADGIDPHYDCQNYGDQVISGLYYNRGTIIAMVVIRIS